MSRKSKAKAKANQEQAPEPDPVPEVFGGEQEHSIGKDDAPIVLTRSDPSFERREKLAEELWEREKDSFEIAYEPPKAEGEEEEKEEDAPAEDTEPEPEEEAKEEPEGDEEAEEEAEAEEEYETLKVYGETIKRPKSEVEAHGGVAKYQKTLAAEKLLQEAAEERRQVAELLQEVKKITAGVQPPRQGAAQEPKPKHVPTAEEKQRINTVIEKLQYGDEDERTEAYYELIQGRESATPEMTKQIADGVLQELQKRQQEEVERWMQEKGRQIYSAVAKPREEGGCLDILPPDKGGTCEDPGVWAYYNVKVEQLLGEGKPQEPSTYLEAADLARKAFGMSPVNVQDALSERRLKKREIDVVKGVKAKTPATPQQKEDSHEDILNEHRISRGLIRKEL